MKPNLLVCLGNPVMGDDAIGWRLYEHLRLDPGLPPDWDILFAGTDLLALAGSMEDRRCVVLADAMGCDSEPGTVDVIDLQSLDAATTSGAHQMSAIEALRLIQITSAGVQGVRFLLFAVAVDSVRFGQDLSPPLAARFPTIAAALTRLTQQISQSPKPC